MHCSRYILSRSTFRFALHLLLLFSITAVMISCNSGKLDELTRRNDSLLNADMKNYGKYQGALLDLKAARDSIKMLSDQLYQNSHPAEKTYVFIAISYTRNRINGPEKANCVSDILTYDSISEEDKYKLLDQYTNTFLQRNNIIDENSINARKTYSFNNYVDASKKREEILKNGIDQ